jgi:hypothetical protein
MPPDHRALRRRAVRWGLFLVLLATLSAAKLYQIHRFERDRVRWLADRAAANAAYQRLLNRLAQIPLRSNIREEFERAFGPPDAPRPDEPTPKMRASGKRVFVWRDPKWDLALVATFNDDGSRYDSYIRPPKIVSDFDPVPPLWHQGETLRRTALGAASALYGVAFAVCLVCAVRPRGIPSKVLPFAAATLLACALVTAAAYLTRRDVSWAHRGNYLLPTMLALPFLFLHLARRRTMPTDFPACPACHYNLTGNTSGICPECGAAVTGNA